MSFEIPAVAMRPRNDTVVARIFKWVGEAHTIIVNCQFSIVNYFRYTGRCLYERIF